jgi:hypothetical protein
MERKFRRKDLSFMHHFLDAVIAQFSRLRLPQLLSGGRSGGRSVSTGFRCRAAFGKQRLPSQKQ